MVTETWGLRSHGLLRLPYHLRRLQVGGTNCRAELRVVAETPGTVVADADADADADNVLGNRQLWAAAEVAWRRHGPTGSGPPRWPTPANCGALGLYTVPVTDAGQVGLAFSTGPAVMPLWAANR